MCGAVARVCRKCALQLYATVVNLLIVQDRNISYGGIIRFRFYGYNLSSTIHAAPLISCLVRTQNYANDWLEPLKPEFKKPYYAKLYKKGETAKYFIRKNGSNSHHLTIITYHPKLRSCTIFAFLSLNTAS